MANFSPLTAEVGLGVWGTPANFNEFLVLDLSLHRHHSPEANETLHDLWPSPGLVHCMFNFGGSCPLKEFYQLQNSLCVEELCPILAALLHDTWAAAVSQTLRSGKGMELRNFHRGCHLYLAGRPSRWASAHVLVMAIIFLPC